MRSIVLRALGLATLMAGGLLAPRLACANDSDSDSDDALARGVALRRERRDAEALVEFRSAYAATHAPRALAQIALAEGALGRWPAAESDLARALVVDDDWIARQRSALQLALVEIQGHLASLDVAGDVDAEVFVDGESVGRAPLVALRVAVGHRVVELRAPGRISATCEIDLRPGETVRAELALGPEPVVLPAEVAVDPPPAVVAPAPVVTSRTPVAAWAVAGGAALFGVGGVGSTIWGATQASRYNDDATCSRGGSPRSVQCASTLSAVHTAESFEAVGYTVAGVLGATSALLFLTTAHPTPSRTGLTCAPSIGGGVCTLRF